ncbi:MAG: DUF86 domain-containing protein [Verrucomicrobia bacterium]|nr:DUF86 domain-containing protein [Verrucomicrobiota bacterium]
MTDEAKKLLLDLLTACRAIESFAAGRSFAEYEKNEQFRAATERKFEIIGEALSRLTRKAPEVSERISEVPAIIAFRNRITHGYDAIDDLVVWDIVEQKVPVLKAEVQNLLREAEPE